MRREAGRNEMSAVICRDVVCGLVHHGSMLSVIRFVHMGVKLDVECVNQVTETVCRVEVVCDLMKQLLFAI